MQLCRGQFTFLHVFGYIISTLTVTSKLIATKIHCYCVPFISDIDRWFPSQLLQVVDVNHSDWSERYRKVFQDAQCGTTLSVVCVYVDSPVLGSSDAWNWHERSHRSRSKSWQAVARSLLWSEHIFIMIPIFLSFSVFI